MNGAGLFPLKTRNTLPFPCISGLSTGEECFLWDGRLGRSLFPMQGGVCVYVCNRNRALLLALEPYESMESPQDFSEQSLYL